MVDVSMGYNSQIGWIGETSYAEGIAVTLVGGPAINDFGIVTDFNLAAAVERADVYGVNSQTRVHDPVLKESYELSVTVNWQESASQTLRHFLSNYLAGTNESYLIRIQEKPDGATWHYLYLLGCVPTKVSAKYDVGGVPSFTLDFRCKQLHGDDWFAALQAPDDEATVTSNAAAPQVYHGFQITFPLELKELTNQLQSFSFDYTDSPVEIRNFSSDKIYKDQKGAIEVNYSGSCYGDSALQALDEMISKLSRSALNVGDISVSDGTYTLMLHDCSYNGINTPIKEKELVVIDFEGKTSSLAFKTYYEDSFSTSPISGNWTVANGGGAAVNFAVVSNTMQGTTGAVIGQYVSATHNPTTFHAGQNCQVEFKAKASDVTSLDYKLGFYKDVDEFAYFYVDVSAKGNAVIWCGADGGAGAPVDTTSGVTMVNNTYNDFRIKCLSDGSVYWYIDGVLVASAPAATVATAAQEMQPYFWMSNEAAATRTATVDYFRAWKD